MIHVHIIVLKIMSSYNVILKFSFAFFLHFLYFLRNLKAKLGTDLHKHNARINRDLSINCDLFLICFYNFRARWLSRLFQW